MTAQKNATIWVKCEEERRKAADTKISITMLSPFVHDDIREKYMVFIHEKKSVTIRVNKGRGEFGEISWPTQESTQPERA